MKISISCFTCVALFVVATLAAGPAAAQPSKSAKGVSITPDVPLTNLRRNTFSGNEAQIAAMHSVNSDCTSGPLPDIRVVTAPSNGELRLNQVKFAVSRPQGNPRANCNGKNVDAVGIFYKSKDGFVGPDSIVLDVDFRRGTVRRFSYSVQVR